MIPKYVKLISSYVFSNRELESYYPHEQMTLELAIDVLTTHGAGGKFMELLIRNRLKYSNCPEIHGWDAYTGNNRPVEIKTETVNKTKKIFCESSFSPLTDKSISKKILYMHNRPLLVNTGLTKSAKCIYIMVTDTSLIADNSMFFTRLDAKSPRINFGHILHDRDSFNVVYRNEKLIRENLSCIRTELKQELTDVARLPL